MTKRINVGVIGVGRIGKIHIENIVYHLREEAQLTAICDVNVAAASKIWEKYQVKEVVSDYRKIIDNPHIDALIICSPTHTHAEYIIESAYHGKHVFCEKPIDLSLQNIKKAQKAVKDANVKFMVGFNRRFDPHFSKLYQSIQQGQIGTPHLLKITSFDPKPPSMHYLQNSGGIFVDMTIHDFDMARFLTGREVLEVYSRGNVLINKEIALAGDYDTAVTTLYFDNGSIGIIDNSRYCVYGYDQRMEVFGSNGRLNVSNCSKDNLQYINNEGEHHSLPLDFFLERYSKSYLLEMKSFFKSILKDSECLVEGKDGLMSMAIALSALKSTKENRVVKISEIL